MEKPRLKVFLDTSALIAGIASSTGAARELFRLAELGLIEVVISRQVVVEADRNIEAKMPEIMHEYRAFIALLAPLLVEDPTPKNVKKYSVFIDPDDAPILDAAVLSGVDYLVTCDRKHFLKSGIKIGSRLKILSAGEFLKLFRNYIEDMSK